MIYLLNSVIQLMYFFFWGLIVGSGLITLINTFRCLNKLGTKKFKLNVSYEDLKAGGFEEIGKFLISISIPTIVLSTFFSVIGLYMIISGDLIGGYTFIAASIVITSMLSILLYKNTTHIHKAISDFKDDLKHLLLQDIQDITDKKGEETKGISKEEFEKILLYNKTRYKTIHSIHEYYDRIDEINDWPFNPTSVKKLVITLGSSLVPLLLSFIGFS